MENRLIKIIGWFYKQWLRLSSNDKTVSNIEAILIEFGATNIVREYKNGRVSVIRFVINIGEVTADGKVVFNEKDRHLVEYHGLENFRYE